MHPASFCLSALKVRQQFAACKWCPVCTQQLPIPMAGVALQCYNVTNPAHTMRLPSNTTLEFLQGMSKAQRPPKHACSTCCNLPSLGTGIIKATVPREHNGVHVLTFQEFRGPFVDLCPAADEVKHAPPMCPEHS